MAKNIVNEQEWSETVQHKADKFAAQMNEAIAKAAECAAKNRKRKLVREVARCFFAVTGIACLYMAETAGLISNVLTVPVYAAALVFIGWHLCKIDRLVGRK